MQREFKSPFVPAAKGHRGYTHEATSTSLGGVVKRLKDIWYPDYEHKRATKSETLTSGMAAKSTKSNWRRYGKQTPQSAAMKGGARVGTQLQEVYAACKTHETPLGDFVKQALLEKARKRAKGRAVVKSKQGRSKAAIEARRRIPEQVILKKSGEIGKKLPDKVLKMMGRLMPITMRVLAFIVDQGWCIAGVELIVGHLKLRRATGVDLLLWDPAQRKYILTELKTGFGSGAHEKHTGNRLKYPFEDRHDSPQNFIQLQVLCTEMLFRETFPDVPLLPSQELLVRDENSKPEIFPLPEWASSRRDKFWSVFSKQ